jgi:hypothetical protein
MTTIPTKLRDGNAPEEIFASLPGTEEIRNWFRELGEARYAD